MMRLLDPDPDPAEAKEAEDAEVVIPARFVELRPDVRLLLALT